MKKLIPLILGLMIILLLAVNTAAGSKLLSQATETIKNGDIFLANQSEGLLEADSAPVFVPAEDEHLLEARLKIKGDVFYCGECTSPETCEFVLMDDKKETLVEGDSVRTGADGTATISFGNEVDLELSSNTQVRILKYQVVDDETIHIYIEQLIGEAYFNVKYSKKESEIYVFKILTPTAITEQFDKEGKQKFSGVSTVRYEQFAGLTSEELAEAIDDTFSVLCGALCFDEDCSNCLTFADLSPVDLQVDDLTGNLVIEYINEDEITQTVIYTGQTFRYIFDGFEDSNTWIVLCQVLDMLLNDETPAPDDINEIAEETIGYFVSITPVSNCGDGVCDIYDNEDKKTCPQDCK